MISEVRQYLWLRLTILGTGIAVVASLSIASVQLWPIVQRIIVPTKLACGCAVLSVTTPWWLTTLAITVITVTTLLVGLMAAVFIGQLRRSRQQEQALYQQSIEVVFDERLGGLINVVESKKLFAMTIGFFKPSIYVSRGLLQQLTSSERQAVLDHERAHQQAYDPLITALISAVSTVFRFLPGARDWMSAAYSLRELAADAVATDGYRQTEALASAFVKLSTTSVHPAISAFSPNTDRLEKLLNHQWTLSRRWWNWSAGIIVLGVVLAALSLGHVASAKNTTVPPAAALACHETIVMCQIQHLPALPSAWLCAGGRCVVSPPSWSTIYDWTPVR